MYFVGKNLSHCLTLPDVGRIRKLNIADCEPEVPVSLERNDISTKFQRPPNTIGHAVLTGDTADIARCRPTTEIQNGELQTGKYPYFWNRMR